MARYKLYCTTPVPQNPFSPNFRTGTVTNTTDEISDDVPFEDIERFAREAADRDGLIFDRVEKL